MSISLLAQLVHVKAASFKFDLICNHKRGVKANSELTNHAIVKTGVIFLGFL